MKENTKAWWRLIVAVMIGLLYGCGLVQMTRGLVSGDHVQNQEGQLSLIFAFLMMIAQRISDLEKKR